MVGPAMSIIVGTFTHALPFQYCTVSVDAAGAGVAVTLFAAKAGHHWSEPKSAGSWTVIWCASAVDTGKACSVPLSWTVAIWPAADGIRAGLTFFVTATASRSVMEVMSSVAVAVAVEAASAPVTPTSLLRVSSVGVWVAEVVTVNGSFAVPPGAIVPVNVVAKLVTTQSAGGAGSESTVVVVCGAPAPVPSQV